MNEKGKIVPLGSFSVTTLQQNIPHLPRRDTVRALGFSEDPDDVTFGDIQSRINERLKPFRRTLVYVQHEGYQIEFQDSMIVVICGLYEAANYAFWLEQSL